MKKWLFWDFDGTLAYREGMFSGALMKVLKNNSSLEIDINDLKVGLRDGFPWHEPEKCYESLCNKNKWWEHIEGLFTKAYVNVGVCEEEAKKLAILAHMEYINPDSFTLYPDTLEILDYFKNQGWSNSILSNHTPDLHNITEALGLSKYIESCISSANIGYEKPNSLFFKRAFEKIGRIDDAWMIGDNFNAHIQGEKGVGIKGILVRSKQVEEHQFYSPDLLGLKI